MKPVFLFVLVFCASCGQREESHVALPPPYQVSLLKGEAALSEVAHFLQLGPCVSGTEGARNAAVYLKDRLASMGVPAEVDGFLDVTPDGSNVFRNVVGVLAGKKPGVIILAAHYDLKSGINSFMGANDSGSGVGELLALAPILKAGSTEGPSVWIVFLDGEECRVNYGPDDGLHGSRHFAAKLVATGRAREVKAFILLDMIGDKDLTVTIPRNGAPELISAVFSAAAEGGVRGKFSLSGGGVLDDHQPFIEAEMPAVDLIDFEYGSAPRLNDYWHTAEDTLDKLSADSLEIIGQVVLRVVNGLTR
jgi:glutaminyl-peptide cyclotransferase